jgi:hypothetical protein
MKDHRWIVAVVYRLSDAAAAQAAAGQIVHLGHDHRIGVDGPGCLDCERTYEDAHGTACDAQEKQA